MRGTYGNVFTCCYGGTPLFTYSVDVWPSNLAKKLRSILEDYAFTERPQLAMEFGIRNKTKYYLSFDEYPLFTVRLWRLIQFLRKDDRIQGVWKEKIPEILTKLYERLYGKMPLLPFLQIEDARNIYIPINYVAVNPMTNLTDAILPEIDGNVYNKNVQRIIDETKAALSEVFIRYIRDIYTYGYLPNTFRYDNYHFYVLNLGFNILHMHLLNTIDVYLDTKTVFDLLHTLRMDIYTADLGMDDILYDQVIRPFFQYRAFAKYMVMGEYSMFLAPMLIHEIKTWYIYSIAQTNFASVERFNVMTPTFDIMLQNGHYSPDVLINSQRYDLLHIHPRNTFSFLLYNMSTAKDIGMVKSYLHAGPVAVADSDQVTPREFVIRSNITAAYLQSLPIKFKKIEAPELPEFLRGTVYEKVITSENFWYEGRLIDVLSE